MMTKITTKNQLASLQVKHNEASSELAQYKLLVDSVEDYAIFLMDTTGHIMTWNKGAQKNKGYKPDEIIGRHFSTFYTQEDIDDKKPERELEIAVRVGRIEDEDWRIRKDGSRFWANVVITALFDENGNHVGFAKVTRDLTERKQQEDSLRKVNAVLQQQQKELTRLNISKDEFISLASHQLRTPATAIKQLLGLLIEGLQGDVDPLHLPILQKAYDSNERQIAIINSLLKVAQIDAGKVVLRKTRTDINRLLKDIIEEQRDTIERREQTVTSKLPTGAVMATVDSQYLRMALENIVDNASKYTPIGGKIEVSSVVKDGMVVVAITDNGVGIAQVDIKHLFEKFNRIPNRLTQKMPGSGLGLYWVEKVIDMHDGSIRVQSAPEEGTTFYISLPIESRDA